MLIRNTLCYMRGRASASASVYGTFTLRCQWRTAQEKTIYVYIIGKIKRNLVNHEGNELIEI